MCAKKAVVITGPSGAGKSTVLARLVAKRPELFSFAVSATTRSIRPGEKDGREYHFVTKTEFERKIEGGEFVEHATFAENLYGTPFSELQKTPPNKICILDIEKNGVLALLGKKHCIDAELFLVCITVDTETLRQRLHTRGEEHAEQRINENMAKKHDEDIGYNLMLRNSDSDETAETILEETLRFFKY
ncbi:MAG: guanylate kinase [Amphiamblys sp. WSBS2006]|nr:MAG: guanylate kinase [Amphiamblys sp. WSBS2006]